MVVAPAILHLRVPGFAVAVERRREPRLRDRPVVVAYPAPRAPILDLSEEARRAGLDAGMPRSAVGRLCRDAAVLSPVPDRYRSAMSACRTVLGEYSPSITAERWGCFTVDLTGTRRLLGPETDVARRAHERLERESGFGAGAGLSASALVSRVASSVAALLTSERDERLAAGPTTVVEVPPGEEADFLAPLSVSLLPDVGRAVLRELAELNVTTLGELAALSREELALVFGRRGRALYWQARGLDVGERHPVAGRGEPEPVRRLPSVSRLQPSGTGGRGAGPVAPPPHEPLALPERRDLARDLDRDTNDVDRLRAVTADLAARAASWLRERAALALSVRVLVFYADGPVHRKRAVLAPPTDADGPLVGLALELLDRALARRVRVRRVALSVDPAPLAARSLPLFGETEGERRRRSLDAALDVLHARFGWRAIRRGGIAP